jgi:alpha-tubulin suppressor-like RCC1 family protein
LCECDFHVDVIVGFNVCQPNFIHSVQVSCGEAFSVALDEEGCMYTTGSSEFGQLGNGETGERIIVFRATEGFEPPPMELAEAGAPE